MTTSYAPEGGMLGLIADIRFGVDTASDLINGLINGVNSVLSALPSEQIGGIRDDVAALQRMFNDGVHELGRALDHAGDPEVLRGAGAAWAIDIGGTVSRLSGFATDNMTRADNHWTGDAADAYRNTLLPQRLALNAIKTTGDEIDAILNELANAIVNFWRDVEGALLTLLTGLAAAVAAAAGVITAPVAVGIAAGLLLVFKDAVISQINMFTDISNEISIRTSALQHRLADDTAFPNGAWPPSAATDMSDGSITDGDDTDWHVK